MRVGGIERGGGVGLGVERMQVPAGEWKLGKGTREKREAFAQ